MLRKLCSLLLCLVLVVSLDQCASGPGLASAPSVAPFSNIYLDPTSLKVGYHTVIGAHSAGCPSRGEGQPTWSSTATEIEGTLPPGLQFLDTPPRIEGTPRQPGTWTITYVVRGVSCIANPDVVYGDRRVRVSFIINP